jgi:glutamine amidotransferase
MQRLNDSGMRQEIESMVVQNNVPILGICVGMQMMANSSAEGKMPGLGWVDGTVRKFDIAALPQGTLLPHMGWNDVRPIKSCGLFKGMEQAARFYFLHSYYFECRDECDALALSDYGKLFTCALNRRNIYGVQFHPEKSHHFGSQLLKNYSEV